MRKEHTYVESVNNTLTEFSSVYPFHSIKNIEYYRPAAALIISLSAANGGGALVFTTKDGSEIKDWQKDLFIREFKPLGYQNNSESYQPHYVYDLTQNDESYDAAWLPIVESPSNMPSLTGMGIQVEGMAEGFIPVIIRK